MNKIQMQVEFELPDWATYIGQDDSGMWFAYEVEPYTAGCIWNTDKQFTVIGDSAPPKDWTQELYTLEWEHYL